MGRADERDRTLKRIASDAPSPTRGDSDLNPPALSGASYLRHPLPVRLVHWINVLCLLVLTISGVQIYTGRQWFGVGRWHHFFFAWIFSLNGLFFTGYALWSGHLFRDLLPRWNDLRQIGSTLRNYLRLRHPEGEEARRYNVLQKIAYTGVVFGLGPLILLTGLASSAGVEAVIPGLHDLFGTRQRARAIHFDLTILFIAYTAAHLLMVVLTGFRNNVRSMLTGRYRILSSGERDEE
ncbi:MAG: hypothetical protein EPO39_00450 [Candidatus Manganitrophaceae bacterium]|nr:MAG: hypothetical protein EPO39_00450 [Candidatus Manganitrophaceae bacterium]